MPRITPVGDDAKGPHEPHFERSRQLWGTVPSFYRALAHSPEALEHIIALTKALRGQWRGEPARMPDAAGHPGAQHHEPVRHMNGPQQGARSSRGTDGRAFRGHRRRLGDERPI